MNAKAVRNYKIIKTVLMNLSPIALVSHNIFFLSNDICCMTCCTTCKTDFLRHCWFQGMYLEIAGPTLPDLKHKIGVNYEEISRSLAARSVGYFISSLVAGVASDMFPR